MPLIRGCAGLALVLLLVGSSLLFAQSDAGHRIGEPRARDIGIPFDGTPGSLNAITDVVGVKVGYKTLISGEGKLVVGKGSVRTGVTAILPRGKSGKAGVFAGLFPAMAPLIALPFLAAGAKRMGSRLTGPRSSA
jgi:hypothetical protein